MKRLPFVWDERDGQQHAQREAPPQHAPDDRERDQRAQVGRPVVARWPLAVEAVDPVGEQECEHEATREGVRLDERNDAEAHVAEAQRPVEQRNHERCDGGVDKDLNHEIHAVGMAQAAAASGKYKARIPLARIRHSACAPARVHEPAYQHVQPAAYDCLNEGCTLELRAMPHAAPHVATLDRRKLELRWEEARARETEQHDRTYRRLSDRRQGRRADGARRCCWLRATRGCRKLSSHMEAARLAPLHARTEAPTSSASPSPFPVLQVKSSQVTARVKSSLLPAHPGSKTPGGAGTLTGEPVECECVSV